jgi:hypothetical protein
MTEHTWRDHPRFNPAILWSAFPSISVLYQDDWADIKRSTSSGLEKAYIFPRAILADRSAAFRGHYTASTSRTVASAMHVGDPGPWWWEPVRRQVLRFAGVEEEYLDIALEGYGAVDPAKLDSDPDFVKELTPPSREPLSSLEALGKKPLVTYISRQNSRRRLTPESHEDLVQALEKHAKANGWELMVVQAEKLAKEEQLQLAARTTVSCRTLLCEGCMEFVSLRVLMCLLTVDYAGCTRERFDASVVDASYASKRRDRDVRQRGFCKGL